MIKQGLNDNWQNGKDKTNDQIAQEVADSGKQPNVPFDINSMNERAWTGFDSGNIHSARYDAETRELFVRFKRKDGSPSSPGVYKDVPEETYIGFEATASTEQSSGKYLNTHIKGQFAYENLK